jgi:arsenate reductase
MPATNGVLFVCSHNSARSQMAEGWLRHLMAGAGDRFQIASAGVEPGTLHPLAVEAMAEVGIDISHHRAKSTREYLGHFPVYYLIIVCDKAAQTCPRIWPGARERLHWFFDDPSATTGSREEKLKVFRRVRDEIRDKITGWLKTLPAPAPATAGSAASRR